MNSPRHAPSGDASFRTSLLQHVGGGALLVAVVAALFWVIGSFSTSGQDGAPLAGAPGDDEAPHGEVPDADEREREVDSEVGEPLESQETDDAEVVDEVLPAEHDEQGEEDPGTQETEEEPADASRVDPGQISVQVLDGYQEDGGAAATSVADQLAEAGYNIVARNPALRYQETTVLWTAGFETEGRQVAAEIGAAQAREKDPGNLSDQVAVHVVVGADRG